MGSKSDLVQDISPLVRSALDSFFHSLDHDGVDTERDRRFTILHLDHSIELLLKEKIKRLGQSLWCRNRTTISIYDAKEILEKQNPPVDIPEWTDIEDLHQIRNDIEHFGSTPSNGQNSFYVRKAKNFIERFCKEELNIDIRDFEKGYKVEEKLEEVKLNEVLKESENLFLMKNYYSSFLNSYIALEVALRDWSKKSIEVDEKYPLSHLIKKLNEKNLLSKTQVENLMNLLKTRNNIVHHMKPISKEETIESQEKIKLFLENLYKKGIGYDQLREFIEKTRPRTKLDTVLTLVYGLLKIYNIGMVNVIDLRNIFEKLRLPIPKNINFILIALKKKGFVEVSTKKKDSLQSWYITLSGENYLENLQK
jgi:uncharacterized protein YutE (UPF0331/DUF86 family)